MPSSLGRVDVLPLRPALSRGRFGAFRNIRSRFGLEPVAANQDRFGGQAFNHLFRPARIGNEMTILDVSILFRDQPFNGRPRTRLALAAYALDMSAPTHILSAEGDKTCAG